MLEGTLLRLRPVRTSDLDGLYPHQIDLAARGPYIPLVVTSETRFRKAFEDNGLWTDAEGMLLAETAPDGVIGEVGFFRPHVGELWSTAELYYQLYDPALSGRGYMSEAVGLLSHYLLDTLGYARLQLHIHPENKASQRIAERCGYSFEGIVRGAFFLGGQRQDFGLWSRLATDPKPERGRDIQ